VGIILLGSRPVAASSSPLTMEEDWELRSTQSGVFYRHNMTYTDESETTLITNDATMRSSAAGAGASGGASANQNVWDTTRKLSGGGSWALEMLASVPGGWNDLQIDFSGKGSNTKAVIKHQFYWQFAFYADSVYRDFYYGDDNTFGGKIAIIESWNQSFDNGEVVIRRAAMPGGVFRAYRKTDASAVVGFGLEWAAHNDITFLNFYDAGSPTVTNTTTLRQRYGHDDDTRNETTFNSDLAGSPLFPENDWIVFETYVDQVNDIVKIWAAPYGSAPVLVCGAMNASLPAVGAEDGANDEIYTGVQHLNYPNTAEEWPETDTRVCYTELIGSDDPINFPGGFSIPHPGTDTPPGYPPSGGVEE
jgi:hypothetical protein